MPPTDATETRRGLPVKRPKGKPFTYTDDGIGNDSNIQITVDELRGGPHINVWCCYRGGDGPLRAIIRTQWSEGYDLYDCERYAAFAAALRWAVQYARRWNARHGLTEGKGDDADA